MIPPTYRKEILKLLHGKHPREPRMKSLACSFVFWPCLDSDIEQLVKSCSIWQQTRKSVPHEHNFSSSHGPSTTGKGCTWILPPDGKGFLILVYSHSKWLEVFYMPSTTSKHCTDKLGHCFACFGLASTVVTDNGPQFTSQEFKEFLEANGVHHILTPPYHPASN